MPEHNTSPNGRAQAPRVTVTQKKNGHYYLGNMDLAAFRALISMVTTSLHDDWPARHTDRQDLLDGANRIAKALKPHTAI